MASNIKPGQTIRVTIRFIDFNPVAGTDELLDPSSVSASIYKYNSNTSTFVIVSPNVGPVVRDSLGIYYYDWKTTEDGLFRVLFTGALLDATPNVISNPRDFFVGSAGPSVTLVNTVEYLFLSELTPLYLDPDSVGIFWPDMFDDVNGYAEVVEIIYRNSIFLQKWFGENVVITPLMEEFLLASALCELSRIHDDLLGSGGSAGSFTLGDLQVAEAQATSSGSKKYNRGNIDSWCEYAAMLRTELMQSRNGMKAIVRGSNFANPIPSRQLRRFE